MEQYEVGNALIRLVKGDITSQDVDAIVNAANSGLMGGGGVDGAIHRAAGPSVLDECRRIVDAEGNLPTGQAVATGAGHLPTEWVIHTVGPFWRGGSQGEDSLLCSAYSSSLALAAEKGARTVAFPSISTGAYRFPIKRAARLALVTVAEWLRGGGDGIKEVRMVLYSPGDHRIYCDALDRVAEYLSD